LFLNPLSANVEYTPRDVDVTCSGCEMPVMRPFSLKSEADLEVRQTTA